MLGIDSLRISGIDPIGRAKDNENLMLSQEDYLFLFDFIKKHSASSLPVVWSCTHYFGNTENTLDPTGKNLLAILEFMLHQFSLMVIFLDALIFQEEKN